MKLAIMSYTLGRQGWFKTALAGLESMCRLARELDTDGVDMVSTHGVPPAQARRILDDQGVKTVCYTFYAALHQSTAVERSAGVDAIRKELEVVQILGTDKIMVITPGQADVPRDVTRRNMIRGFQEAAALARGAGITMTIENFPGAASPFAISSDILEAIREAPGLKLTFDNGNAMLGGEDPAVSFTRCAAHVVHAHFKDWARVETAANSLEGLDGRRYQAALIGEGLVDHKACLVAMKKAGYAGYIDLEYEGNQYKPDEATRRAARYLQKLIGELE